MVEISSGGELETWLEGKPVEWSQVLTARISLRILPLIIAKFVRSNPFSEDQLRWFLASFRATLISWATHKHPAHNMVSTAVNATDAAFTAANATDTNDFTAYTTALAIAYSAATTNTTVDIAFIAYTADTALANATDTAFTANTSIRYWASISADCEKLLGYDSFASAAWRLVTEDLWFVGSGNASSPEGLSEAITAMEQMPQRNDDNWHVWTDWYRALLQGRPCWGLRAENAEKLVIRIAEQKETFWSQSVDEINAEIAEWLADIKDEEAEQSQTIKQEINILRQALADTKLAHGGMGHNEPPEGFELSVEIINQVEQVVDVIDTEMDKAEPSFEALTHSANVLKATLLWAAKKADLGADAFVTQLGKVGAIAVAGMLLPIEWQKVYVGIGSVLEKILQWLSIGTPPI